MGKGGAGKQHVQATPEHLAHLRAIFEEQRKEGTDEADLLNKFWWMITDTTLRRFITANNCDIEGAQKQVLSHLAWRGEYDVDKVLTEDFSDMAARNELYWRSFDEQGHPVLVWNAARHNGDEVSPERYTRYFVWLLETGQREFFGGPEKPGMFCVLVNAKGAGRKNLDFPMMKIAGPIIELNYPERQYRTYVVSVGTLIQFAWRVVSNFLDPGTVFKIRLVGGFSDKELLQDFSKTKIKDIEATSLVPVGERIIPLLDERTNNDGGAEDFESDEANYAAMKAEAAEEDDEVVEEAVAFIRNSLSNGSPSFGPSDSPGAITDAVVSAPDNVETVENAILMMEKAAEEKDTAKYPVAEPMGTAKPGTSEELRQLKAWQASSMKILEKKDKLFNELLKSHLEALAELSLSARALSDIVGGSVGASRDGGSSSLSSSSVDSSDDFRTSAQAARAASANLSAKAEKIRSAYVTLGAPLNQDEQLDESNEVRREKWKNAMKTLRNRLIVDKVILAPQQDTVDLPSSSFSSSETQPIPPSPTPSSSNGTSFSTPTPNSMASVVTKASTVHSAKRKFLFSTKSKKDKGMNGENSQMENTTSEIQSQSNEDVGFGMSLEGMALSLSLGSNLLKPPEELIASRELSMDKALRSCGRAVADHQAAMICLKLTAAQLATCNLELNSLRSLVNTVEKTQREKEDHHKKLVAEVESLKVQLQIANTKSNSSSQGITSTVRSLLGGQSTTTTDKPLSQSSNHRAKAPPPPQTPPPSNNNVLVRAGLGVCVPARGGASRVKPPQPLTMAANESDVIVLNEAKVWVSDAKDALDVAASLLAMMNEVIAACHPRSPVPLPFPNGDITSGGSQGWNQAVRSIGPQGFINARRMPSFQEICLDAAELQRVDMDKLLGRSRHGADDSSSDERSFYLSLLNLLTMHATIKFGGFNLGVITDAHGVSRKVGYHVGGEVLTLLDIKKRLDASVEFSF